MSIPINQYRNSAHSNNVETGGSLTHKMEACNSSTFKRLWRSGKVSMTPCISLFQRAVKCIGKSLLGVIIVPATTIVFGMACFVCGVVVCGSYIAKKTFGMHPALGCIALVTVVPIASVIVGLGMVFVGSMTGISDGVSMARNLSATQFTNSIGDIKSDVRKSVAWIGCSSARLES